jgi:hypothetical protein
VSHISVEAGEQSVGVCADCGQTTCTVWGYVRTDGDPRAVYYVRWTEAHPERGAQFMLSIGRWGDGTSSADRHCVGLECRIDQNGPSFMVVDSAALLWGDADLLGAKLTRVAAMADPIAQEAFSMVDRLIEADSRIKAFIQSH